VLVFLVVYFLLAFPPISYMHSPSPPFVLHALPISSLLNHSNYIWTTVLVTKLLIMQFSQTSRHLISYLSKYSPQHPVLTHPQST
jgi:hypothetical protein